MTRSTTAGTSKPCIEDYYLMTAHDYRESVECDENLLSRYPSGSFSMFGELRFHPIHKVIIDDPTQEHGCT